MKTNPFPRMHVSLYVSDIGQTTNFYTNFFGMEPDKIRNGYAKYILEKPSLIISFVENKERVQPNFGHLGFQVETMEELRMQMEVAESKGLISKKETGTACCYALQDKFWTKDPDGRQWEVYYFHADVAFNDPHFENEETEACCLPLTEEQKKETSACCIPRSEKKKVNLSELGAQKSCC